MRERCGWMCIIQKIKRFLHSRLVSRRRTQSRKTVRTQGITGKRNCGGGGQLPTASQGKGAGYIEDAAAAVAWTFKNIETYGGSPRRIYVSGHSAGGYLTSMVGLDKRWLAAHKVDADALAGLIPYSGHTITHFTVRAERGIDGNNRLSTHWRHCFMCARRRRHCC